MDNCLGYFVVVSSFYFFLGFSFLDFHQKKRKKKKMKKITAAPPKSQNNNKQINKKNPGRKGKKLFNHASWNNKCKRERKKVDFPKFWWKVMLKLLNKLAIKTNIIDKERGIKGRERWNLQIYIIMAKQ